MMLHIVYYPYSPSMELTIKLFLQVFSNDSG